MTIAFYEHPFSSYVQKAKTSLYEKGIPFESKMIDGSEPVASEAARTHPRNLTVMMQSATAPCT
jgi:glutathione S-transferase